MLSKTQLRTQLKLARLNMPESEVLAKSTRIVTQLKKLIDQAEPETIHCFEPIAMLNEVAVMPLITHLKIERPETTIYTSRYIGEGWRIVTLGGHAVTRPLRYDCVIVPMLGFDSRLHRLGYGGGYYDRLLSEQPRAFKIGVCFEFGKLKELPSESHDVPLDVVITEEQIYRND